MQSKNSLTRLRSLHACEPPVLSQQLYERAAAQLDYIHRTMEDSSRFTAVPGLGLMLIGASAFVAAYVAAQASRAGIAAAIWLTDGALALPVAFYAAHVKSLRLGNSLWRGAGRKFLLALAPSGIAALALTVALYRHHALMLAAGCWMCTYGIGVMAAGAYSIRPVPIMGALFLAAGVATLQYPVLSPWLMPGCFGGLNLLFGYVIWKNHGG